jgi:uncharacterized membrane protein
MGAPDPNVLVIYGYKALVILIGFACICLGIWLAFKKVNDPVGDVDAKAGKAFGIKLTRPTASALLFIVGAIIIVYGVTRPFRYDSSGRAIQSSPTAGADASDGSGGSGAPEIHIAADTAVTSDTPATGGPGLHISDTVPAVNSGAVVTPGTHISDTISAVHPAATLTPGVHISDTM